MLSILAKIYKNIVLLNVLGWVETDTIKRTLNWADHVKDFSECLMTSLEKQYRVL